VTAALEATGLGKRYGRNNWALRDCNLVVPRGRIAALVGPNGAGKTTLLHLAVGLLAPTTGTVRVLDRVPGDPGLVSEVGFVAQDTPLYRDFTSAEHLTMGRRLNRRFDLALARSRLERVAVPLDRRVGTLSGGQRAQVALALALAKGRELLLLDEPLASLDPLARREFLQALMGAVAEHDLTVVLSSHLLADLERVCDYLIVLSAAHVQVLGTTEELLARHKLLIGPYREPQPPIAGVAQVVRSSHTDRQASLLVRTDGPIHDPAWKAHEVTLEDVVLAYLAEPSAGALPGPAVHDDHLEVHP
jgi:ABC-2 type transport system ATP-binding protein